MLLVAGSRLGYDVAGNETLVVDANANATGNAGLGTTMMTFDRLNRLTNKSYSDGTPAVSWTFDAQGRVESMVDGAGATTYEFDPADRVNLITSGTDTWAYTYDAAGNVVSRTVPGGANSTATFDDAGQLSVLADLTGSTTFGYDAVGNNTTVGFPNGVTQTRTYDRASRLNTIATAGPGGPIGGFAYTRDQNGNPTGVDVTGPAGLIVAESMRNTFDNADRLTKTCFTTTTCATANQTVWTYNRVGSRLTEKIGSAAVSTYTYDIADQLTAIVGPGAATFRYNANGDQVTAGADTYTYNTARQTTTATVAGVTTQFAYDGNNNRHTTATGEVTTQEVWDTVGGLPVLVAQRNGTGVVQRRFTYAGWMPVKYEDVATTTVGYYQTDALGSVTNLTTPTGTIGATYRYNPYGTNRATTTILPAYTANPLKYTGQQQDPTDNYNLRARHYNPGRGVFTQTDPMPYGVGHPFENLYGYGRNNPMLYTDPTGLRANAEMEKCRRTGSKAREKGWTAVINNATGQCQYILGLFDADCFDGQTGLAGGLESLAGAGCDQVGSAGRAGFIEGVKTITPGGSCPAAIRNHGKLDTAGCVLDIALPVSKLSKARRATKPAGALVEEGTYVVKTAQGEYVGQSGAISRRLQQHVASGKFTQAEVDAAERAMVTGGKLQREIAEQLLIDSKGGIDGLLNKVNPIGPKRMSVMPNQPYKR